MPKPLEIPESSEPRTNLLDRRMPLTIEEISQIRSERFDPKLGKIKIYQLNGKVVSVTFDTPHLENKEFKEHSEEIIKLLKSRKEGESFVYETLIVNALLEQAQIAQKFGLSEKELYLDIKIEFVKRGSNILDDSGFIHLQALARHVDTLMKRSATNEQIITELAGHIFHEAVHNGVNIIDNALSNKEDSVGEVTPVTAQIAYYLAEEYQGPKSYDSHRSREGLKKIQAGVNNTRDYDIATYVAGELLLRSLKETYPEALQETMQMSSLEACQHIVAKLSTEQKQQLISSLKTAIISSADEAEYNKVIEQQKQKEI